jgi:molybdopterin converting factor small subunit
MNRQITILYFGHLVEMLGRETEVLFLPLTVNTVKELLAHLARRGDNWTKLFEHNTQRVQVTVNKQFAEPDTVIKGGDEVAFVAFNMN